jgi:hypothetical protein
MLTSMSDAWRQTWAEKGTGLYYERRYEDLRLGKVIAHTKIPGPSHAKQVNRRMQDKEVLIIETKSERKL